MDHTVFQEISIYPAYPRQVVIQWSLLDTAMPGNYRFYIDRSGSPEGPWETLTPTPLIDKYLFVDDTVRLIVKENRYFYRIRYIDPQGRQFTSSAHDLLRNLDKQSYLFAREINRKEGLRLKKKVGVNAYILKRKHYGEVCSKCVDPETGHVVKEKCSHCYGTKYEGGYYPAIETCVEIEAFPQSHVLDGETGTSENFISRGRMQVYPLVTRADLIVEKENNRRWHIMSIYRDELRTVPVVQVLQEIRLIPPTDVEYQIPVVDPLEAVKLEAGVQ